MKMAMILNTLLWAVLLGVVIYYLCSIQQITWAWIVVFSPLILMMLIGLMFSLGMGIGLGMEAGKKAPMIASYMWESKEQKAKK
jgi:energy-coupling factor transporter transmembrane protein EcfT